MQQNSNSNGQIELGCEQKDQVTSRNMIMPCSYNQQTMNQQTINQETINSKKYNEIKIMKMKSGELLIP